MTPPQASKRGCELQCGEISHPLLPSSPSPDWTPGAWFQGLRHSWARLALLDTQDEAFDLFRVLFFLASELGSLLEERLQGSWNSTLHFMVEKLRAERKYLAQGHLTNKQSGVMVKGIHFRGREI